MLVDLNKLPKDILNQIPLSLRTYQSVYKLEDLPPSIQFIVKDFIYDEKNIEYTTVFDIFPEISEYGDFGTIKTVNDVVLEYLKNYFLTLPNDYPFDPLFGSRLKMNLQTKDTQLRQVLISNEVDNIVAALSADLGARIVINDIKIQKNEKLDFVEYDIIIDLTINGNRISTNFNA